MLKSIEDITQTKKRLRIEIPADLIEREIKNSIEKLKSTVKIPGFRPGKAPASLIEKRFWKQVEAEVIEKVVPEQLGNAIKESFIEPVTMPVLEEEFEYKRSNPLEFSVTVEVKPKIGDLSYEGVAIKDIPVQVEDPDIENALTALQNKRAVFEVADKVIEMDDFVSFEYVDSEMTGSGNVQAAKDAVSKMGNEIFPPDIMDRVLGKQKGDIIEFEKTFSAADSKDLAGRTARITIKIAEVKRKTLPEINDDFAKDLGCETMAELREKVREKIHAAKTEHVNKIHKAEIVRKLVEANTFEVPESLVQREIESIMMHRSLSASQGPAGAADVSAEVLDQVGAGQDAGGNEKEDLHADTRSAAVKNVQAHFILDEIGRKEGILVSDAEVDARVSSLAQKLSATPEAIRNYYSYKEGSLESLRRSILEDKIMDMLLASAVVEKENP